MFLIFIRFYHKSHMRMRRHGYLKFYRITQLIRSLPLIIISAANSVLVVLIKITDKYCPEKCTSLNIKPNNILQIFTCTECAIMLPILIYYLGKAIYFDLFSLIHSKFIV